MADFIFYSTAGLTISLLLYFLFLKKEKHFHFNRFYLLGTLVLCLLAPVLEIDYGSTYIPVEKFQVGSALATPQTTETVETTTVQVIQEEGGFTTRQVLVCLYAIISILLLIRFSRNLFQIIHQVKTSETSSFNNYKIIATEEKANPYSFFNYLFINASDLQNTSLADSVITHETAHSRQLHSLDIIFLELLTCFLWFNPLIWLYKREILENHEYLADAAVLRAGTDISTYSTQLIHTGDLSKQPLMSGFSFIKTKNRINMLHTEKTSRFFSSLKIGVVLVIFSGVFILSAFAPAKSKDPFVVVVDAGHGGHDPGNLNEKEVTLQIAQQLKQMSADGEIEIVLIRDKDEFFNLHERVNFVNALQPQPDMFLSLHCNSHSNPAIKGAEAYYSAKNPNAEKSLQYSEIMLKQPLNGIAQRKISEANFMVLRDTKIPAILLELGFLSNPTEAAILKDPEQQLRLAGSIYERLKEIKATAAK